MFFLALHCLLWVLVWRMDMVPVKYRIFTLTLLQSASDVLLSLWIWSTNNSYMVKLISVPCPWRAPESPHILLHFGPWAASFHLKKDLENILQFPSVLVVTFRIKKTHSFFFLPVSQSLKYSLEYNFFCSEQWYMPCIHQPVCTYILLQPV